MKLKIIILIIAFGTCHGQSLSSDREFARRVASGNAEERLLAIKYLTAQLKNNLNPSVVVKPSIPVSEMFIFLQRGVSDSNGAVRAESLRGISVMLLDASATAQIPKSLLNETRVPLARLLGESDPEVQAASISIYSKLFSVSRIDLERWTLLFKGSSSKVVKKAILNGLLKNTPSTPEAERFVIEQIGNPSNGYEAAMAILTNIKPPPLDALEPMIYAFASSPDPGKRDLLARALQRYGATARPYLRLLETARDQEADPTVKANFILAIKKVSETSKQPLANPTETYLGPSGVIPPVTPKSNSSPYSGAEAKNTFKVLPIFLLGISAALVMGACVFFFRRGS